MDPLAGMARAARAGDGRALERLVEATYDQVWQLCAGLVDDASADDLAQESLERAVRSLSGFRGDSSARVWFLAIARNTCLDELRTRYRRRRLSQQSPGRQDRASPEADIGERVAMIDLVRRLEPDRRSAFVLTQLLGLSYAEAAQVCGCPSGTIRSRVSRARTDLIAMLEERKMPGSAHQAVQRAR